MTKNKQPKLYDPNSPEAKKLIADAVQEVLSVPEKLIQSSRESLSRSFFYSCPNKFIAPFVAAELRTYGVDAYCTESSIIEVNFSPVLARNKSKNQNLLFSELEPVLPYVAVFWNGSAVYNDNLSALFSSEEEMREFLGDDYVRDHYGASGVEHLRRVYGPLRVYSLAADVVCGHHLALHITGEYPPITEEKGAKKEGDPSYEE